METAHFIETEDEVTISWFGLGVPDRAGTQFLLLSYRELKMSWGVEGEAAVDKKEKRISKREKQIDFYFWGV